MLDLPGVECLAAWPAFWLVTNNTFDVLPVDVPGNNLGGDGGELDMLEQYNYWGLATAGDYQPSAPSPLVYGAYGLTRSPLPGNNLGGSIRAKIQMIYSNSRAWYYLNGKLMFAKDFQIATFKRASVAVNLAMGTSLNSSLTSNGFWPVDASNVPNTKVRLHSLRVLSGS
ncbi:hypothetical protein [Rhizobium sp. SAFR-030]|uniref:hypothetical protein n=1 Tax=Rhizobium sp. SAFR-030 TaxID=3387277 RepID=UPI003F7FF321